MKIINPASLCFNFLDNGSIRSIEVSPIRINLKEETLFSGSGTNIFLRKRAETVTFKPLLGPASNSGFKIEKDLFIASGSWTGLEYTCTLRLSESSQSWQWQVDIKNTTTETFEIDLIYLQDIALKPMNSGLINEYYISQYLERLILEDEKFGSVICCRQNSKEPTGHPWLMLTCKNGAASASTDGMLFYGKTFRETGIPEGLMSDRLGGEYAGESSVLAIQEQPFKLDSGEVHKNAFIATYLPDHPIATSAEDLKRLPGLMEEFKNEILLSNPNGIIHPQRNLFNTAPLLQVDDFNDKELNHFFGKKRRHSEKENGQLLSFFSEKNNHIVLRTKETITDRPHAHIMQAKAGLIPTEDIISNTSFAFGVFSSHLTQGNTNFNTLLSVCTSQFNQSWESGQRIFVEMNGCKYLLGVPSAFEIGLNHCRWIYKHGESCFQIRTWTSKKAPQVNLDFKVISGNPVKLLITHNFDDINGWDIIDGSTIGEYVVKPGADSMIAAKFLQAQFRIIIQNSFSDYRASGEESLFPNHTWSGSSFFVLEVGETTDFCMSFIGEVNAPAKAVQIEDADYQWSSDCQDAQSDWQELSLNLSLQGEQEDFAAIREILPWYGMNALIHYLTPYGLEQFSGAAWGTRDVSQGPVELLLTLGKYNEARKLLCKIFSNQNPDGGWPQWWMFDSYRNIRAHEAHGDIFYWCIMAVSNYIKVTGDTEILYEILPYYHENGDPHAEKTPLTEHVERLINMIVGSFIPGTSLVPFGGGDWNDSLQPVSKDQAARMISSWTVEMNYQAFSGFSSVYELIGNSAMADKLGEICDRIKADFNKYLVVDGVVAGYGVVEDDLSISILLHPKDHKTGIHYSILPMNRGIISGLFTKEQAKLHQDLIEMHLKGPDGARLMDHPLKYKGGIETIFQRAESSTFFGREIGLMYVHEHIRYAEALALMGKADAFIKALRQAIPVGYRDIVPCGDFRQSNCYYSSSDVVFKNRYEADEYYDEIRTCNMSLKGGWRIYSSGPGIYIGLIVSRLLGLRIESGIVIIDPVVPFSFDGLSASLDFMGRSLKFVYTIKDSNFSPKTILVNGKIIAFTHEENKYRQGGAVIPKDQLLAMLNQQDNILEIQM